MKLAAIFVIFFAILGANAVRPPWIEGVDVKFQTATPFHNQYSNPHLAHVVSWSDIEAIVNAWNAAGQQAGWDLVPFVNFLTEVDTQACVYNPQIPTACTLHTTILNNNIGGQWGTLNALNTAIRNTVVNEINNGNPITPIPYFIKRLLNSAPANLRYGTGQINVSIQGWTDPMGDNTKGLTTKEKSLIYATDANGINHLAFPLVIPPGIIVNFNAYATYFRNVILVRVPAFNIQLRGTHYDPTITITTAANHQFQPLNAANTRKLYVMSSSQAGACPLTTPGDQNTPGDTIQYYVKNV